MSWDVPVTNSDLEKHRQFWAGVAKENGWYKQPFFVQVWATPSGKITDSVSFPALEFDTVLQDGDYADCSVCGKTIELDFDEFTEDGGIYYCADCG